MIIISRKHFSFVFTPRNYHDNQKHYKNSEDVMELMPNNLFGLATLWRYLFFTCLFFDVWFIRYSFSEQFFKLNEYIFKCVYSGMCFSYFLYQIWLKLLLKIKVLFIGVIHCFLHLLTFMFVVYILWSVWLLWTLWLPSLFLLRFKSIIFYLCWLCWDTRMHLRSFLSFS